MLTTTCKLNVKEDASRCLAGTTTSDVLLVGLDSTSFMRTGVQVVVQGHHGPLCARHHHLFLASLTAASSLH